MLHKSLNPPLCILQTLQTVVLGDSTADKAIKSNNELTEAGRAELMK